MRRLPAVFLSVFCSVSICVAVAGGAPPQAAADKANGALVDERLDQAPSKTWRVAKGRWEIVDGAWRGAELPEDKHGAVARIPVNFTDAVVEFEFKLEGAKMISLSINDPRGHNSRLAIRPTGFVITKDDHDHAGPDQRVSLGTVTAKFEPGRWYRVRLEERGPKLSVKVGDYEASGEHAAIAVPKSNVGFTVSGQSASFKNLRVTPLTTAP